MHWAAFAIISIGAAAIGIGIVLAAGQIEQKRRVRHIEQFGDH
jgi:hypothetical protein